MLKQKNTFTLLIAIVFNLTLLGHFTSAFAAEGYGTLTTNDTYLNEPFRDNKHRPEPMRTDPPLKIPKSLVATGVFFDHHEKRNINYTYTGHSLYGLFKNCIADLKQKNEIKANKVYVTVSSDKKHIQQCLTPHQDSQRQMWTGYFSICEQITKEVAATHGIQSNCSRYAHKDSWYKTLKEPIIDSIKCSGKKQQGTITKSYERLQKYVCLFSQGVPTEHKKRGDLIQEKKSCSYKYDDCKIGEKIFKHKVGRWLKTVGSIKRKLSCGDGFSGYKLRSFKVQQTYVCNDGNGVAMGDPIETANNTADDVSYCVAHKKRCGAHAHADEWEVRVGRKIVEKSCVGGRNIEISYPKLRTMYCDNGQKKWKDSHVDTGTYPVTPTQSCRDSQLSNTLNQ